MIRHHTSGGPGGASRPPREAQIDDSQDGRAPVCDHERLPVRRDQRTRTRAERDVAKQGEEHPAILEVAPCACDPERCGYGSQRAQKNEPFDDGELQVPQSQVQEAPVPDPELRKEPEVERDVAGILDELGDDPLLRRKVSQGPRQVPHARGVGDEIEDLEHPPRERSDPGERVGPDVPQIVGARRLVGTGGVDELGIGPLHRQEPVQIVVVQVFRIRIPSERDLQGVPWGVLCRRARLERGQQRCRVTPRPHLVEEPDSDRSSEHHHAAPDDDEGSRRDPSPPRRPHQETRQHHAGERQQPLRVSHQVSQPDDRPDAESRDHPDRTVKASDRGADEHHQQREDEREEHDERTVVDGSEHQPAERVSEDEGECERQPPRQQAAHHQRRRGRECHCGDQDEHVVKLGDGLECPVSSQEQPRLTKDRIPRVLPAAHPVDSLPVERPVQVDGPLRRGRGIRSGREVLHPSGEIRRESPGAREEDHDCAAEEEDPAPA